MIGSMPQHGNRIRRYCALVLFLSLASLSAASVRLGQMFDDPNSSERILSDREFLRPLMPYEQEAARQLKVSLVTMGKGDPLYVWFGHSGIAISDTKGERSVLYDYGIFSFDDDFYQTFAIGRLNYEVWATATAARIALATEENRDIYELVLNLPDSAKLEVLSVLNYNVQQEHQTYLYHHYRENCSTRIRDIIDKAVGGQLHAWASTIPMEESIRQLVGRHTYASPFVDWTLNFLQSGTIDKPITLWEAMFLPALLEDALRQFSYVDEYGQRVPIAGERIVHHVATEGARAPVLDSWHPMTLQGMCFALAVGLLCILLGRFQGAPYMTALRRVFRFLYGIVNFIWTLSASVLSILLIFMMTGSNHDVTYFNENILIVNPLVLVLAVLALASAFGNARALRGFRKMNTAMTFVIIAVILLKLVFIDLMIQQNWQIILTMLPLHLCNSTIPFERILVRKRRVIDDSDF